MKQHSEKRTEEGVKILLQTLTRNWYDTGIILDEFEATHNDLEYDRSKQYAALDKINNQLNKK